jgi:threonine/homoserine/homoserine lactone efflux protein
MYVFDALTETNLKNASRVVIGITLGNALEIILSVLGISILAKITKEYPTFFYLACAGLLFHLEFKSLISSFKKNVQRRKSINSNKYILTGFIMILLNPKALIFWSLMLSPVIIHYSILFKVLVCVYFIIATFLFVLFDVFCSAFLREK